MVDVFQTNDKVWEKFCHFFRFEKLHDDWTDDEINMSYNGDDVSDFISWLIEILKKAEVSLSGDCYGDDTNTLIAWLVDKVGEVENEK